MIGISRLLSARGGMAFFVATLLAACVTLLVTLTGYLRVEDRVRFATMHWDFGKVRPGESLTCEFPFTNNTRQDIRVTRVRATCGCIAHSASEEPIAPGNGGAIRVTLKTHGIRPPQEIDKRVVVEFESPGHEPCELRVRGRVCPEISCDPGELVFRKTRDERRIATELAIRREMLPAADWEAMFREAGFRLELSRRCVSPRAAAWWDAILPLALPYRLADRLGLRIVWRPQWLRRAFARWIDHLLSLEDGQAGACLALVARKPEQGPRGPVRPKAEDDRLVVQASRLRAVVATYRGTGTSTGPRGPGRCR